MAEECAVGLIGLAVMGENLALNIAAKGFRIAVYNRTTAKASRFVDDRAAGLPVAAALSIADFVRMLAKPRKIILMVQAGQAVDDMLAQLTPLLEAGDIVIDGGNLFLRIRGGATALCGNSASILSVWGCRAARKGRCGAPA